MGGKMKVEKQYTPRSYQNEFMELIKNNPEQLLTLQRRRTMAKSRVAIGIDLGQPGGDKTVITQAKVNKKGQIVKIYYNEYESWPRYKWYKNPIKWVKWQRLMRRIGENAKRTPKDERPRNQA